MGFIDRLQTSQIIRSDTIIRVKNEYQCLEIIRGQNSHPLKNIDLHIVFHFDKVKVSHLF